MFDWIKKERCKACREERSVRYCLRKNKDIGWKCCNGYRADSKCPEACPYTPKTENISTPLPQIKSDSRTEFLDFLDRYLQLWVYAKIPALNDKTPQELSQNPEGKAQLMDWLSGFSYPDSGVLEILNKRLNLELAIPKDIINNPETLAMQYLNSAIAQDWDKVLGFYAISEDATEDIITQLIKHLAAHPVLKKVKSHETINAGFTQDLKQSYVFCELNGKENWTFIFVSAEGRWHLFQTINGTLQDYYVQKILFRDIALKISQKDESAVSNLLTQAEERYPLCADIQYYCGLYYTMLNKTEDAKNAFLKTTALDRTWQEPIFQLAMLYLNEKDYQKALTRFEYLAGLNSSDINVQNNLGVCYLGLNQLEKAREIWTSTLKFDPNSEVILKNLEHLQNG